MKIIKVATDKPYDVVVGQCLIPSIVASVSKSVNQIAIIHAPVMDVFVNDFISELGKVRSDIKVLRVPAPDSEQAKTIDFVNDVWAELGKLKFTRSDILISIGGGATTDVAGFIAATWLRGIGVIHVPTTLLAMVDAAVGGKTGINTEAGKNLVGSFHHPLSVWCDTDFLNTLPFEDLRAGFAEIIKCGFISDLEILKIAEREGKKILNLENTALSEVIERAISVKANVVAADFKEEQVGGLGREILNYGHTFGHAIENLENYTWRHGDAISVGMMFVAYLSNHLGLCSDEMVERQLNIFKVLGLPVNYQGRFADLVEVMAIDKKSRGPKLRFIGLEDFSKPVIITSPSLEDLEVAFKKVSVVSS